jgi:hypothetical protein
VRFWGCSEPPFTCSYSGRQKTTIPTTRIGLLGSFPESQCLGRSFVIAAVEQFDGVPFSLARIDVGHVLGKEPWEHTIWVEQEYLQPARLPAK